MFEFILHMAFQELEWNSVDEVDFDDAEADILELVHKSRTPVLDGIEHATDNNDMFCFLKILSFLCCWYLIETKHMKEERDSLLLLLSLNPKILFFTEKWGGGSLLDVTQECSREQT